LFFFIVDGKGISVEACYDHVNIVFTTTPVGFVNQYSARFGDTIGFPQRLLHLLRGDFVRQSVAAQKQIIVPIYWKTEQQTIGGSTNTSAMARVRTAPGIVMGTISYMSPEQVRGLEVDARSDIFTLGVVLYEMLTGANPFTGATAADVIVAILGQEPAPLSRSAHEAPKELERIVRRALRKDREDRYQAVQDLLLDLKGLKQELELEAQLARVKHSSRGAAGSEQVVGHLKRMVKRHKHVAIVTLAALIVTAAALVFYFKM
jgi:serine/threonine protein kinase